MREEFLHYIWRFKKVNILDLETTDGHKIDVLDFGQYNTNAGPDFLNGKIRWHDKIWSGHIEFHVNSSDWKKHKHTGDPAYNNVILHVVYNYDDTVYYNQSEEVIPTLELKNRMDISLYNRYQYLLSQEQWIPCQNLVTQIDKDKISLSYYNLAIERLTQKSISIRTTHLNQNENWDQTIFITIARGFGLIHNRDAFQALAESTPINILRKHKDQPPQIEALIFGQAGLLSDDLQDSYPKSLRKEYLFLQHKYNLNPISAVQWKFLRLRPANFPTLRLSQFCNLLLKDVSFFSLIIEQPITDIHAAFKGLMASSYWDDHYQMDSIAEKSTKKKLGSTTIDLIMINCIAPLLFLYGKMHDSEHHIEKSIHLLESIPAERNNIITKWKELGLLCSSAFDSQSLLQLKNEYCDAKKCLQCSIGYQILSI